MGDEANPPKAPDYSPVDTGYGRLTDQSIKLSNQAMDRADSQFESAQAASAKSEGVTDDVVKEQLALMGENADWAEYSMSRFQETFQPVEDAFVQHAMNFNTDAYRDQAMGLAGARVAQASAAELQSAKEELMSYGIDPSSGRFAGLDSQAATATAAAVAAEQNAAGRYVDEHGEKLQLQAAALGEKYPGMSDRFSDNTTAAGNAANTNRLAYQETKYATEGTAPQYTAAATGAMGVTNQAIGGRSGALTDRYNAEAKAYQQDKDNSTGIGGALGTFAGIAAPYVKMAAAPATGGASMMFKDGGHVPDQVSPTGGGAVDDVPALLTSGEYIVPKYAVEHFGVGKFDKMLEQAKQSNGPDRPRRAIQED